MKKNNKLIVTIGLGIVLLICVLLFLSFCSKQPDPNSSPSNNNSGTPTNTPTNSNTSAPSEFKGVNKPAMAEGMKAVKWENNDWVEVNDPDKDTSWYDYKKKPDAGSAESLTVKVVVSNS